jgi:REP element-mobilizing transposase RayT
MAIHRMITHPGLYFITFTCHEWLPLIDFTRGYELVYKWFDVLAAKQHSVTGFVIMPNHLHMILYYAGGAQSLNTLVGNGKRFLAYDIVERLEQQNQWPLLKQLQLAVHASDKRRGKKHEIWKSAFDAKECRSEKFVLQKLRYIHNNPCSGKWKLVRSPELYLHSSALFYLNGKEHIYLVKDYRNFLCIDLWEE